MKKELAASLGMVLLLGIMDSDDIALANNHTALKDTNVMLAAANVTGGAWKYAAGNWYYTQSNGANATGWIKVANKWYYMNASGVMQTGWTKVNNVWYYTNGAGEMQTGWIKLANKWYFLNSSGAMATGWAQISGKWYFMNASGEMQIGWTKVNNQWYFLNHSGVMQTGWLQLGGKWYFLNNSGAMATGWAQIGGKWYYLNVSGVMQTGWLKLNNQYYYLTGSGQMLTGWIKVNGRDYYMTPGSGRMATGKIMVGGKPYLLDSSGAWVPNAAITGWFNDGAHYYYYSNSQRQTGWIQLSGKWYYLNANGTMAVGWVKIGASHYYLDNSGVMATGWIKVNGISYYLYPSGAMAVGWIQISGKWYYLNNSGAMLTGKHTIGNEVYFFDGNGVWTKGNVYSYTNYNYSLSYMIDKQMAVSPQTDLYRASKAYVSSKYVIPNPDKVGAFITSDRLHVREAADETSWIYGTLAKGAAVTKLETLPDWYVIKYPTWRNAKRADVQKQIDPKLVKQGSSEYNQFLVLSRPANTSAAELNDKLLTGKGSLTGLGASFIEASKVHSINEIYLLGHAFLETGNGTSVLAKGITVSSVKGKAVPPKVVYNMFGIGAVDRDAITLGAERAYTEGWDTPHKAIVGGAKFISEKYVHAKGSKQDTLYKMRWNPANPATHQYATDIEWTTKQARIQEREMNKIYSTLDAYTLYFDVPVFK